MTKSGLVLIIADRLSVVVYLQNISRILWLLNDVHIFDIAQWIAPAKAAALVNQLFAEAYVDAAIRRIVAVGAVKVGIVCVDGKSRAEVQGHVNAPSGGKGDVILEKE